MPLSPQQMAMMGRLLDEALELAPDARGAWLLRLPPEHRDLVDALREALLPDAAAASNADGLSTLPKFQEAGGSRTSASLAPGARVGPYELIRPLGAGGMAEVWLALRADRTLKREVALKLPLLTRLRRDLEPRFARERDILASLNHPNIARIFDAGFADDGQPYIALEYIAGLPFTEYCDRRRLSVRARLELFRQVLSAVQYAHAHLVIHRDLKPSNILVTDDGRVQLLDFGIAKLLSAGEAKETEVTQMHGRALTLDYAAPEQIMGGAITTATDVYALGVMLYEVLTGERPYRLHRDSRAMLEEAILQAEPIPPSRAGIHEAAAQLRGVTSRKLARVLRGDLDVIVLQALKKAPSKRYATTNALAEDLERYLRGDVVSAQPDSVAYRAYKFGRRHWLAIAVGGVLLLTLTGGLVATTHEARIAAAQRDVALQAQLRSLTQTAEARLREGDVAGALGISLELLPHRGAERGYTPEALSVFQEARASDTQLLAVRGHKDWVTSAVFSPDGRRMLTASVDGTARIWDTQTGYEIRRFTASGSAIFSAAFSPDGARVITAHIDRLARIWDAADGRLLLTLKGHTGTLIRAAYSPDGRRVVTASSDKTARVWDSETGQKLTQLIGHTDRVVDAAFSPDGKRVVTASRDKTARVWDASTGRQILVLSEPTGSINSAAFSPDGRFIVTASYDKTAGVWDAVTGRELVRFLGHSDAVTSAAFSNDGRQVLTGSADRTLRLWDVATGQQLAVLSGPTDRVSTVAFSPDGKLILAASYDDTARVWTSAPAQQVAVLTGAGDSVNTAAFSPDVRELTAAAYDRRAYVWRLEPPQRIVLRLEGHTDRVESAAFSPDGRRIVTAADDTTARVWDAATGRQLLLLRGHRSRVTRASFSPDGQRIVTAGGDRTACIWDASTGRLLLTLRGHSARIWDAEFSADSREVVTASDDKTAAIWDAKTGRRLAVLIGHMDHIWAAAFSPDGRSVVTASSDKTARIWDVASGRERMSLQGHSSDVQSAAFSPDGRYVVTASNDGTARLWDAATGWQLLILSGHTDFVNWATFSPDGRWIATASNDRTVRIWDPHVASLSLERQTAWAAAAQFDELESAERFKLGMPPPADVRQWPEGASRCDAVAAAPYDPQRRAPGVLAEQIATDKALADCDADSAQVRSTGRWAYEDGRVLVTAGRFRDAQRAFEQALSASYGSARIDLARLLLLPAAGIFDPRRALELYQEAWKDGIAISAFDMGRLYEKGIEDHGPAGGVLLAADRSQAWSWYAEAANADEPDALGRFGARYDESAFLAQDAAKRREYLLQAFRAYAAAAESARIEGWPEDASRDWRYRRASLARLLAQAGMMHEVAEAYDQVRDSAVGRLQP
jgi:WD40 repeat protein/tRNA A-37 threonylcarbamoyl transferase component Bud32/TPR repeat protein